MKSPVDALMSRTRQRLLAALLMRPERSWYLAELARHLGLRPSSLQRDLNSLVSAGILTRRQQGRMVYFQADRDSPIYQELRSLLLKTVGLVDVLRAALRPLENRIVCSFVYGSIAGGEAASLSDVDLLIIGDVSLSEIAAPVRRAWDALGREVSPKLYHPAEFAKRLAGGDHFLRRIVKKPKLFVIGTSDDLEQAARRQTRVA
jgi:DNA-binding transcriptional ArsR family regulator